MNGTGEITLIGQKTSYDEDRNVINEETRSDIMAEIDSVTQTEWTSAGQNGFNAQWKFTIYDFEYNKEKIVEYDGERYAVYRTFRIKDSDRMELYVEMQGGVTNG